MHGGMVGYANHRTRKANIQDPDERYHVIALILKHLSHNCQGRKANKDAVLSAMKRIRGEGTYSNIRYVSLRHAYNDRGQLDASD